MDIVVIVTGDDGTQSVVGDFPTVRAAQRYADRTAVNGVTTQVTSLEKP